MTTQTHSSNLRFFSDSFKRFLPNSQAVSLAIILIVSFVLIYSLSGILMPVFASIVLAYLLEGLVGKSENLGMSRLPAVYLVFSGFMACLGFLLFYLMPLVSQQAV
ncbi:MAG: AI-2E family transporter, partial [Methylococcaceae bacterium]